MYHHHNVTYVQPQQVHDMRVCVSFQDPKAADIIQAAAEIFGIPYRTLLSARRARSIIRARWAAMYSVARLTRLSYPQMGISFGRDHSTVMHGVKMANAILNGQMREKYDGKDFQDKCRQIMDRYRGE